MLVGVSPKPILVEADEEDVRSVAQAAGRKIRIEVGAGK